MDDFVGRIYTILLFSLSDRSHVNYIGDMNLKVGIILDFDPPELVCPGE